MDIVQTNLRKKRPDKILLQKNDIIKVLIASFSSN